MQAGGAVHAPVWRVALLVAGRLGAAGRPHHLREKRGRGAGHADPAVTLRIYSYVLREHTLGGRCVRQAVKASVSKPLANRASRDEALSVCAGESGQGRGRTADLPLFRRMRHVAARGWAWPDGQSSCANHGSLSPDLAWRLPALAPHLAPRNRRRASAAALG